MFMAIPSYAYLKPKIPGPTKIITMEGKTQRALDCEQDSIKLVIVVVEQRELSFCLPIVPLSPMMPPTSSVFKIDEDAKAMQINSGDPAKTVQIGASLDPK
jgi:hypothetical protein